MFQALKNEFKTPALTLSRTFATLIIYHLFSVIRYLLPAICYRVSAICYPPSGIRHLLSDIGYRLFTVI